MLQLQFFFLNSFTANQVLEGLFSGIQLRLLSVLLVSLNDPACFIIDKIMNANTIRRHRQNTDPLSERHKIFHLCVILSVRVEGTRLRSVPRIVKLTERCFADMIASTEEMFCINKIMIMV